MMPPISQVPDETLLELFKIFDDVMCNADFIAIRHLSQENINFLENKGFLLEKNIFAPQFHPNDGRAVSLVEYAIESSNLGLLQELVHYAKPEDLSGYKFALKFFIPKGYDLVLMSELPENQMPEPNKLYMQLTNGAIQYVVFAPYGLSIKDNISNNDPDIGTFTIPNILDLSDPDFIQGVLNITSNRGYLHKKPEPNTLYLALTKGVIQYAVLAPDGAIIDDKISNDDPDIGTFVIPSKYDVLSHLDERALIDATYNIALRRGHISPRKLSALKFALKTCPDNLDIIKCLVSKSVREDIQDAKRVVETLDVCQRDNFCSETTSLQPLFDISVEAKNELITIFDAELNKSDPLKKEAAFTVQYDFVKQGKETCQDENEQLDIGSSQVHQLKR